MTITKQQIIKEIGCPHLTLWKNAGDGYHYFMYDTFHKKGTGFDGRYNTYSIYVMYLKDMSLEQWVKEGKDFVAQMEGYLE